jgi:ATP-dependent RNA helicase SUPV3L1/SUV3
MSIDEVPSETPPRHAYDFSNLQGLQVVGAHLDAVEDHASEAWREALRLELEARAARFHHAVDTSIVLSDDGVIRWLGDPVARLAAGPDLLTPRALVLADASLPESARETVAARLELWLAATTRRLLGPLLAMQSLQDESEPVRQLATKIAESLGVLEREPLRSQVKALDQNSRAALRRHGVRFGAYYVYVPQTLKPASRALALQLWSVRMADASGEEFARALLPLASTGRTSLPVNPLISREGYRVAGFRPCGERAVRVDIVERLSDMIRAALVTYSASDASQASGSAFVAIGQMTSLTGCSGDAFASILRSLGYESFEIERSRLASPQIGARAASAASAELPPIAAVESGTEQRTNGDGSDSGVDKAPEQDDEAEEPSVTVGANPDEADLANDVPDVPSEPAEPAQSETTPEPAEPALSETTLEPAESALSETTPERAEPALSETTLEPAESALSETTPERAEPALSETTAEPAEPALSETTPEPAEPEPSETIAESAPPVPATVVAWRLARRPRPDRANRRLRRSEPATKASLADGRSSAQAQAESVGHEKGERRTGGPKRDVQRKGSSSEAKREGLEGVSGKRHRSSAKQNAPGAAAHFESRRPTAVDPNSPFAKLLELRTALEKQGKNR